VKIGLLVWAVALMMIACSRPSGADSGGGSPNSGGQASVAIVGEPTYPARIQVGAQSDLNITLRNDGAGAAKGITIQIGSDYFDGFILRASSPGVVKDSTARGTRSLAYPELAPGQEQLYKLSVIAKKAGEYPATITIMDANKVVSQLTLTSTIALAVNPIGQ
jgi:hypothetical protein